MKMMTSRNRVDPRVIGFGLMTGAVVGVWAGRKAQEWSRSQPETGLIDWERARNVAISMNRESALTAAERARLDAEYLRLVERAVPLVAEHAGVELPFALDRVYAFDRVDWINANIIAFQHMLAPLEETDLFSNMQAPRAVNVLWHGLNRTLVSAELGVLLGYLARRVLGQYDLALLGREPLETSGNLYFVQPNIVNTERTLGVPPDQFRLWLALHETTHAFEFEAYPWVRDHMNSMIEEYFTFLTKDIEYLKRGISGLRSFWERAQSRGEPNASWIELIMSPEQRRLFSRMQAMMAVVEGYSNYIMNAVGRDLMPDYELIHRRFENRQKQRSNAEQLFIRLTGLDIKLEQYRLGESFINEVAHRQGRAFVQRVWEGPEMLPSLAELRQPDTWISRIESVGTEGAPARGQ
jgi:coenzyme F420 biosynthesis associated uncharacterized protein